VNWPYVAFSSINNTLSIINVFERSQVHQIQLAADSENMEICDTYPTDTNDLFIMTSFGSKYKLFKFDLDDANPREQKADKKNVYHIGKPVLEYDSSEVENQAFKKIHVRGSSHKELVNLN